MRHTPLRLELVSVDEHVVELAMAAAAAATCSCTITAPSEPWSVLAAPLGHSARIVDLAALSSFAPIGSALRVDPDGFVLVLPGDSRCSVRLRVYARAAIAALLDDLLAELPAFPTGGAASKSETDPTPELLVGDTTAMRSVRDQIARVAPHADVAVLVLGEAGTGKELVARSIHLQSSATGHFVALHCAAISEAHFESELFGDEAGSVTAPRTARTGLLETAAHGTLFLDGIGDMPLSLQAKLLRLLETKTFRRLGSNRDLALEARIISATTLPPEPGVGPAGHLRRDLFDLLAGFTIELPPLRARPEDVDLLAGAFLDAFTSRHHRRSLHLTAAALEVLRGHPWAGNVRELRAIVEQLAIVAASPVIDRDDVTQALRRAPSIRSTVAPRYRNGGRQTNASLSRPAGLIRTPLRDLERELIVRAFEASQGNLSRAALELGIPRTTLRDKLRRYGIGSRSG